MNDATAESLVAGVEASLGRIAADSRDGIWIARRDRAAVLADAAVVARRVAAGERLALAGRTVAVKGNIDVAGHRTTAGCPGYGDVAARSAPVVEALEAAGAVVVGITNLDQFATGLVGTRSPHGVCPNAHWPGLISGGSSSGSAVAVAAGLVDLGVGTDTAGSGRVPAAANGIVGVKPTRGRVPATGVVPACRSLDCVSMLATSVELAALATDIAASADPSGDPWWRATPTPGPSSHEPIRVGVPVLGPSGFDGSTVSARRFEHHSAALVESLGAVVVPVDLTPFLAAGALLYEGAFVAERYAAVGAFVAAGVGQFDPTVRDIILRSASLPAWRVFDDLAELRRLHQVTGMVWHDVDVLVVPSVPRVPTVEEVHADPIGVNSMLGTYTNFVNLLDLAAVTIPVRPEVRGLGDALDDVEEEFGPPASLTLIGPAWSDQTLVTTAGRLLRGRLASLRTT